ncbi:lactococcin 972-like bacteriocin [Haloactinospora alba]|uniref:Lactococcin 972-like bacteriocin n=1 Tax=Haloactinospora alba TaxID=405555 RepID=A0A543N9A5_9ACTN|nr:lactococcin 972 family bacteriocin [Haloactinospora alba]TQN28414.1 lactococcin 972-like bacteriocin [Haloactinospora alba]
MPRLTPGSNPRKKSMVRRAVAPVLLAGGIAAFSAGAASAEITYPPEGGKWDHGAGTSYVWSDYLHNGTCHGSTSVGRYTDRDTAAAGSWSITEAPTKLFGNESYYRTTC